MKLHITNHKLQILGLLLLTVVALPAQQLANSHSSTVASADVSAKPSAVSQAADKPVARVNGAVLTDRDLLREMYAIFPYARQHNGLPKDMEAQIRQGALEMIIFDELVYQEALRRKLAIPPSRIDRAEADFRTQFPSREQFQEYLKFECKGSPRVLRERIRRSLLVEALLKTEVQDKASVSLAEARAFYDKNPENFEHGESFAIQTISIIPPQNASPEVQREARKRAEDALRRAKATKSYREFGLLAEKVSDDDWHVNMGDRKTVEADKLPPPLVEAARAMKPSEVSNLLQFGPNYTLFRLNAHTPAGKTDFESVKAKLRSDLQKTKAEQLRAGLNQKLRKHAKIEVM